MCDHFITGIEVSLRPIHSSDKYFFLKWYNDQDIRKNIGGIVPFSEGEFKAACEMIGKSAPSSLWFSISVDGHLVGISGLHQIRYLQRNAEISVLIGEAEFRNKGIATEVIGLLEKYSFDTLQLHRLYAHVFFDNPASIRLFEKCGWEQEGRLREAAFWDGRYRDVLVYGRVIPKRE